MSSSNCCLLVYIQIFQEIGKVVWSSHLFKNFQFVVIHTVKGFSILSEAEVDVFLEFSCCIHFFYILFIQSDSLWWILFEKSVLDSTLWWKEFREYLTHFKKLTTLYILLCKVSPSAITLDLIPILLLQESYAIVYSSLLYSACLLICFKNVHPLFFNFLFFFLTTFCSLSFSSLTYQSKLTYDLWYVWPFQLPGRYLEWVLGKTWSQNKKKEIVFSFLLLLYYTYFVMIQRM